MKEGAVLEGVVRVGGSLEDRRENEEDAGDAIPRAPSGGSIADGAGGGADDAGGDDERAANAAYAADASASSPQTPPPPPLPPPPHSSPVQQTRAPRRSAWRWPSGFFTSSARRRLRLTAR